VGPQGNSGDQQTTVAYVYVKPLSGVG